MIEKMREHVVKNASDKMVLKPRAHEYTEDRKTSPRFLEDRAKPKWMRDSQNG